MRRNGGGRLRLSILDHTPVSSGSTLGDAFWHSTKLAELAEQVGYERYWVAEHPQHAVAGQLLAGGPGRARGCPNHEAARRLRWHHHRPARRSSSSRKFSPLTSWAPHPLWRRGCTRSPTAPERMRS